MSVVAVLITTDHEDHDDGCRSVIAAMKRAGYDVGEYHVTNPGETLDVTATIHVAIEAAEPEVTSRANQYGQDVAEGEE